MLSIVRALLVSMILTACGGGGGGGGGGSGSSASFAMTSHSATFAAEFSQSPPPPVTLTGVVTNFKGDQLFIIVDASGVSAIQDARVTIGATSGTLELIPAVPANLGLGTHTGEVIVRACTDRNCNSELRGSPQRINVNFTVNPAMISLDQSVIDVTAQEGGPIPNIQDLIVDISSGYWTSQTNYLSGNGWLNTITSTSSASSTQIPLSLGILPIGQYSADISFTDNSGGTVTTLKVNYDVIPSQLGASSFPIVLNLDSSSLPQDLIKSFTLHSNEPGPLDWSAQVDQAWLTVLTPSGNTDTSNILSIALNEKLADNPAGILRAVVKVSSPQVGIDDYDIPVELQQSLPVVQFVSPSVGYLNQSDSLIVRGYGFNSITSENLRLGIDVISSFEVLSDTEIWFDYGNLAIDSYGVLLENNAEIALTRAELHVVDPPTFSPTMITTPGKKYDLVYDELRKTIYVSNFEDRIDRFTYNGGAWVIDSLNMPYKNNISSIALSPDKKYLAVNTAYYSGSKDPIMIIEGNSVIRLINTETFKIEANAMTPAYFEQMAFANNGELILIGSLKGEYIKYNIIDRKFVPVNDGVNFTFPSILATSGDQSAIYTANYNRSSNIRRYDASIGVMTAVNYGGKINSLATDKKGSVLSANTFVLSDQGIVLGELPFAKIAFSPDGLTAYVINSSREVELFDLATPNGSGGFDNMGVAFVLPGFESPKSITISPDGAMAFVVFNTSVLVQPLP